MQKSESTISNDVFLEANGRKDTRIFRNNVGVGWCGTIDKMLSTKLSNSRGYQVVVLNYPRCVRFGLKVGSGDFIGLKKVTITKDMVGKKIAQFLSIECKTKAGKEKEKQHIWKKFINRFGGLAGVARCKEDVAALIGEEKLNIETRFEQLKLELDK